jgi:C1A family cysteine protease
MKKLLSSLLFIFYFTPLCAQPDMISDGTIDQNVPELPGKTVQLVKLKLSTKAENFLSQHIQLTDRQKPQIKLADAGISSAVQLGMNNIPVLDQGQHGTCVTFATTAILDALIGRGDYISQVCTLALNQYISTHGYTQSSWGGALPKNVFSQIEMFGIVNKDKQKQYGCGGLTEYPNQSGDPNNEIAVDNFHDISENINNLADFDTSILVDAYQFFKQETSMSKIEMDVKTALNNGDRLTIGTIVIPDSYVGIYGKNHAVHDTWVLSSEVINYIHAQKDLAGHAMIITGYDDNAIATDGNGKTHKGLFTLRNSWGEQAGDKGNYYMSYDYFRNLAFDIVRVRKLQ